MPNNVEVSEEVADKLQGQKVSMNAPVELQLELFGREALTDVEAVITPIGTIIAFELTNEEVRAIKHGQTQFLIHFLYIEQIPPFRLIFESEEPFQPEETNGTGIKLPESGADEV